MKKQREHWGSRLGFVMAAAGSAIGLGTLWKFPYVAGANGGGAFIFIYLLCTLFVGIPLFSAELMLGRRAQRGAVGAFADLATHSAAWRLVGWMGVAASFLIMSYYSVIAGWGMSYALMSMLQFSDGLTPQEIAETYDTLSGSADITLFWHLVFTAITVSVVYHGVRKGIEKWSRVMTSSLLVLLVLMFLYGLTLSGFAEAFRFICYPDFSDLKPSGVLEALGLAFFTLSLGQGIMITYGSYLRDEDDLIQTSMIVGIMDVVVSLLAALTIFPIIFTFGSAPDSGPGLVFKTLPMLFSQLPASFLLSTTFFVLFVFTALTSSVALVEVVVANFMDLFNWDRRKTAIGVGVAAFLFGIPSALSFSEFPLFNNWAALYGGRNFFATVDALVTVWLLPLGGLLTAIFVGWILEHEISEQELLKGSSWRWAFRFWCFFIRWLAPIAVLLILLQKSGLVDIDQWLPR